MDSTNDSNERLRERRPTVEDYVQLTPSQLHDLKMRQPSVADLLEEKLKDAKQELQDREDRRCIRCTELLKKFQAMAEPALLNPQELIEWKFLANAMAREVNDFYRDRLTHWDLWKKESEELLGKYEDYLANKKSSHWPPRSDPKVVEGWEWVEKKN